MRSPHILVCALCLSGCLNGPEEVAVSGPLIIAGTTTVNLPDGFEPKRKIFEVCVRLREGFGAAATRWQVVGPDGSTTEIFIDAFAGNDSIPLSGRSFLLKGKKTLACAYEVGSSERRPRRRYTSLALGASKRIEIEAIVLRDYDPK